MDFNQRHDARTNPDRLRAVDHSGLVGSSPEARLDSLTRLAVESLGAAASFISVVDRDSDYYKSCFGFPAELEKSRTLSGETFCHFTLVADGVLAIEDARTHPTFRLVPTVQSLGVVAYLGVPIRSGREVIGAFCVIDTKPRHWTTAEIDTAVSLARVAVDHLQNREVVADEKPEAEAFFDFLAPIAYAMFLRITRDETVSRDMLHGFVLAMWEEHRADNWREPSVQAKMLRTAREYALPQKVQSRPTLLGNDLSNLPDFITATQRRLLALAYFDGLTVTQIAAAVSRPEDEVRNDLIHAVQALHMSRGSKS